MSGWNVFGAIGGVIFGFIGGLVTAILMRKHEKHTK